MEDKSLDMKIFCNTLLDTYNTSFIDKADKDLKDALLTESAKKCAETNKAKGGTLIRDVLSRLILNHEKENDKSLPSTDKKPIADFIAGPFSLTVQWSQEYKKLIYIFGENHNTITDCPRISHKRIMLIEDYLEQLFATTDVFIDFFNEIDVFQSPAFIDILRDKRIIKIYERFKNCKDKSLQTADGKCALIRSHFFDVRQLDDVKINSISLFILICYHISNIVDVNLKNDDDLQNLQVFLNNDSIRYTINDILDSLSTIKSEDEYYEFWNDQIDTFEFLQKKISRTKKDKTDIIKKFISEQFRETALKICSLYDITSLSIHIKQILEKHYFQFDYKDGTIENMYDFIIPKITDEDYKNLIIYIYNLMNCMASHNSFVTDIYLLSRMFKEFDIDTKDSKKKRNTDEPKEAHNIIIYAGDKHSDRIRKFLDEELGFKLIDYAGKKWPKEDKEFSPPVEYENCIRMGGFTQPFFSELYDVDWLAQS